MAKRKSQRERRFVDPEVQGALARRMLGQWVVFVAVAALLAIVLEWLNNPFAPVSRQLAHAWWQYGPLLLVLICLLPIFVLDTIKVSNRFVGPICRVRHALRALASGERPERIEFRQNDFWRGMADEVNLIGERIARAESRGSSAEPPEPSLEAAEA